MSLWRVLIADPHPFFRAAAARLLAADPCFQVVACVPSCSEALDQAAALEPDVVVLDLSFPGGCKHATVARLKALPKAPQVVVLSLHDQPPYQELAQRAGADGFLSKAEADCGLLPLIRKLIA